MRLRKQLQIDSVFNTKIKRKDYLSLLKHKLFLYFDFLDVGVSKANALQVAGFKDMREFQRAQSHFSLEDYRVEN